MSVAPAPRRHRHRLTLWLVATGVVVSALVVGARWFLERPYLRVQHVTVVGLRHESTAAVLAASGLERHPSMLDLNEGAVDRALEHFSWITSVSVTKHWPNSVTLDVHEARAVAVAYDAGHHLAFVSASGRDLGPAPLKENLPTLHYVGAPSGWPYEGAGRGAANVAARLPVAFAYQVSVISEDATGDVSLELTTPVTFALGADRDLHAKFVAVASVIAHSTLVAGDVVDVSVPDEVAVSPPASK